MHFLHPDHFPVTQIEVKIYFWFIWVAFEQQKWQKKNQNRKMSFWRWDSNVPKILNSVLVWDQTGGLGAGYLNDYYNHLPLQ